MAALAGNVVFNKIPADKRCSPITASSDDDATAAIIESVIRDEFDDVLGVTFDDSSRRHVAGVSKRRSHGSSDFGDGYDSHDVCEVRKSHAEIDKFNFRNLKHKKLWFVCSPMCTTVQCTLGCRHNSHI